MTAPAVMPNAKCVTEICIARDVAMAELKTTLETSERGL